MLHDEDDVIAPDWEEEALRRRRERRGCIPGHLASPINETDCKFIKHGNKKNMRGCTRHLRLKTRVEKMGKVDLIQDITRDPIGYLQKWIKEEHVDPRWRLGVVKNSVENLVLHKMNFQRPLLQTHPDYKIRLFKEINYVCEMTRAAIDSLYAEFKDMVKAEKIKDQISFKNLKEGDFLEYRGLIAEPDICILKEIGDTSPVMFSTNLLLCALDKVQGKFNMLLYCKIGDILGKYEGLSMYTTALDIITKFESIRPVAGNDFFAIANLYEPLILGWVVANKMDLGCVELFDNSYEEIRDILVKYDIPDDFIESILPDHRSINNVKMYIEISGLVKSFGYPILDAESTLSQVFDYGMQDDLDIDMNLIADLEGLARRDLCVNHYRKYRKLPNISECPPELDHLLRNKLPPVNMNKRYDLWRQVKFTKTLEYDYSPDQSDLIKDSAGAINSEAWAQMFDPCAFREDYGTEPPPMEEKIYSNRIILEYLSSTPEKVKQLITERDNGILSPQDHICVLCQKECELNIKGRSFTKQTPPQRLIQVSLEHNIAKFIFPLVPEQSMIDSEIKNVRRHLQQVKNMQSSSQFINLDLKKWCLHQRHASNEYLGRIYDELFGMKTLFQTSHLFFNGCLILPNNRLIPPMYNSRGGPTEGNRCTRRFIGGMEGMQQKKWTHGAIVLIKYVMESCGLKGEVMGQGDNQVILLHFAKGDNSADEKRDAFITSLELHFRRIGHRLKKMETWYSKYLHEYSKQRMYMGSAVSYSLKKSTKVIPDINDGLFSIPSSLSTINTITEGIARADYDPDAAYIMNCVNITNYLCRKGIINKDSDKLTCLLFLNWPIDFGGINISSYHSHAVRGNDDKVSIWLSLLDTIKEFKPDLYELCLSKWILKPNTQPEDAIDRKNLYEDIYSLNVPPHPSAESDIKDMVVSFLKGPLVTNPAITRLYDENHSASYEEVIRDVDQIRPVFPPLSHELLKNSNAGLFIRLQGKLTHSKTIEKIVNENVTKSLIDLIREKNEDMVQSINRRLRNDRTWENRELITQLQEDYCPTQLANILRNESWNVDIIGVTKPSWSHQCIVKDMDDCSEEEKRRGITVRVSGEALDNPRLMHKTYGPMRPFVGSTTKEKINKKATLAFQDTSTFSSSATKLRKVRSWLTRLADEKCVDFCNKLIHEKRDLIEVEEDIWDALDDELQTTVAGNLFHRFKCSIDRDTAMINCLPSVTGQVEYSSNSMKDMTAGGKDFNIFYQYLYTSCTESLAMMARTMNKISPMYMILFPDCDCVKETPNPQLRMSGSSGYDPPSLRDLGILARVADPRGTENLRSYASFIIGREIANNIDENFRLSHQQGDITVSSTEYKKGLVSINDMRLVDFESLICSAILFSRHCRRLYLEKNRMMLCLSDDRSFLYLAELILESDLVPKLLELVQRSTNEHSGVCSIYGISSYISRNMPIIMRQVLSSSRNTQLVRFAEDDFSQWVNLFRFLVKANKLFPGLLQGSIHNKLDRNLKRECNLSRLIRDSELNIQFERLSQGEILAAWKLSDRGDDISVRFRPRIIGCRPITVDRYPIAEVGHYHFLRSSEDAGDLKVPQLSFLARPLGSISSAANKALECLLATGLFWFLHESDGYFYFTAEGSGSIVVGVGTACPYSKIIYNTWMRPDIANRDLATDAQVPAWTDARLDPSRLVTPNPLAVGETDIVSERFLGKMLTMMEKYPPTFISMDAESDVETNNLHFLTDFIIPVAEHCKAIFLVKLFHMSPLHEKLTRYLAGLNDYSWTLYKPISSNPVGPEVYLIMCPKEHVGNSFRDCQAMQPSFEGYLGNNMNLSEQSCNRFVDIAFKVSSLLRDIFPTGQLDIPHRFQELQQTGAFCSVYCKKFLSVFMKTIDELHTSENDTLSHLATRGIGINEKLYDLSHSLIFLFLYHGYNDTLFGKLRNLSTCKITRNYEEARKKGEGYLSKCPPGEGDLWGTWKDARMFMREMGKLENPCSCKPEAEMWTWDVLNHFSPRQAISWQLFSSIIKETIAPGMKWDLYSDLRHKPKKISVNLLDHKICNPVSQSAITPEHVRMEIY